MKATTIALTIWVCLVGAAALLAQQKTNPGFERLKSLIGNWEAKTPDGKTVNATYQIISSGTALMETLNTPDATTMVTVFHPDGERLVLTHYCAANNQPRMAAEVPSGEVKRLTFGFVDVTNLASTGAGHMHGVVITFEDANHFTAEWTWREKGKDGNEVFRFQRKK